ncbi:flagellar hook-basal body complex protein [Planctomycetota bacterium]
MSFELFNSVTGPQPPPKSAPAGNNQACADPATLKTGKISFAEALNKKIQKTSLSGTAAIINTGNPLDMAIQGQGFFVLSDGSKNIYTRTGAFAVDANHNLIDPATGYKVQRIGSIGVNEGFQSVSNNNITIPYNTQIPAKATSMITLAGNLRADTLSDNTTKTNVTVYDSKGQPHNFSLEFARTNSPNTWDMLLTSAVTDTKRINGIQFDADNGSFKGLASSAETTEFEVTFADGSSQTIGISIGTPGKFNGLTQFPGNSTVLARQQDGYQTGTLSNLLVNNEGVLVGHFSNGIEKNIAALQLAVFQNNSDQPTITQAMTAGAGSIHTGALEKSNTDVENDFVNMIHAQNGFATNAGTIRAANDVLREIGTLI